MPKFLDHHPTTPMPPEMAQVIAGKIQSGEPDEHGTVALNVIVGEDETWCLVEAPNADAVHKGHEAIGIKLGAGDIAEVQTLA
jgi:hypothetical protein